MPKIRANKLMLLAGSLWLFAGINVGALGVAALMRQAAMGSLWPFALMALVVFVVFHRFMLRPNVARHVARITAYANEPTSVWRFFDKRGYILLAVMMGGGMALRASGVLPNWFVAGFYTGLGLALIVSAITFYVRFCQTEDAPCTCKA